MHAICPDDCPQKRSFKHFEINFGRLSICFSNTCQTSQQFQCALPSQSVVSYTLYYVQLILFLQITVIKNLAEEEKKDTKAFLKQQPFAKPGDIYSTYIYQSITDLQKIVWVSQYGYKRAKIVRHESTHVIIIVFCKMKSSVCKYSLPPCYVSLTICWYPHSTETQHQQGAIC